MTTPGDTFREWFQGRVPDPISPHDLDEAVFHIRRHSHGVANGDRLLRLTMLEVGRLRRELDAMEAAYADACIRINELRRESNGTGG